MEKILIKYDDFDEMEEAFAEDGPSVLWNRSDVFEISASACITLTKLRFRWPSMTEKFIAKYMGPRNLLPLAGLETHFRDLNMYRCIPIPEEYTEYLTIPQTHPEYAARFPSSYQCFKDEYSIKDFVLPLFEVEWYEQAEPELLRPVALDWENLEDSTNPDFLREVQARLSRLEESDLIANRKQYLAAVLYTAGIKARVSHTLISGKQGVEENGRQERAREWRNKGLEKLNFDLDELKDKKII